MALNPARSEIGPPDHSDYNRIVVSMSSALLEDGPPEAESPLSRARAGDTEAFGEICQRYESRLLRQAFALCRDEAQAEDLAEDTLVEAWRCLRRYNGRCQF